MLDVVHENVFRAQGLGRIAGVDEVGRGPLAGPVVAAAVVVPDDVTVRRTLLAEARDSKTLTAAKRQFLSAYIYEHCVLAVGEASVAEIDALNIRQATLLAMARAVHGLAETAEAVLVDGLDVPEALTIPGRAVVKGDGIELAIACASIVAKVARDGLMRRLAETFPGYGWESNVGYSSAVHMEALTTLGPTPHHRTSFAPVRAALAAKAVA